MLSICKSESLFKDDRSYLLCPSRSLGGADGWSESATGGELRLSLPCRLFSYIDSCCISYRQKGESGHSRRVSWIPISPDTLLIDFQRKCRLHPRRFLFDIQTLFALRMASWARGTLKVQPPART